MKTYSIIAAGLLALAPPLTAAADVALAATAKAPSDAYEQGRRALDRAEWQAAREAFDKAIRQGENVDASLYWKAYAETKAKDVASARESIARLKAGFPSSQWVDDAEALAIELRGGRSGDKLPEDEELKLYALQMLMLNDPERAEPLLKKYIEEGKSDELREKAMFILLQHPDAANSDLLQGALAPAASIQMKMSAIRLLGMLDDEKSRELLDKAYRESEETAVKHMIIQSYMMQDNAEKLARIARNEKDPELKRQAVHMLAVTGEIDRIRDMYKSTDDPDIRRAMMQGFAMAGEGEFLLEVLENETDPEIRDAAISHLVMVDSPNLAERLANIYRRTDRASEKRGLVQAMAMHGESDPLIALYRQEKDPEIRRQILQSMALFMDDERVADFFEEFLKEE